MAVSQKKRTPVLRRVQPESGLIYGFGLVAVLLAIWITFQFIEPAPPRTITLSTGNPDGAYHYYGLQLREQLAEHGVDVVVLESEGSVENLQRLADREVDVAFVQSGLASSEDYPDFESLGAMYYEPVWILFRSGMQISTLKDIAGLRVAVGGEGSGTRSVALRLLVENGLTEADVYLSAQSGLLAADALAAGEIDAIISVAAISASMIERVLSDPGFTVVDLARAPAYARRHPWLMHLTLPEGVVDLARNLPDRHIDLLAVNSTLIGTNRLHPALRDLLLQAADSVFSPATLLAASDQFPSITGSDFPLSADAIRYYEFGPPFLQRYLPFWIANLVDRLKLLALPLLALILPLSRLLPPAYRWAVRKKIYRWYDEVQELDKSANADASADHQRICLGELRRIENELRDVNVPLSYAHELYGLRHHVELLSQQIIARLNINRD